MSQLSGSSPSERLTREQTHALWIVSQHPGGTTAEIVADYNTVCFDSYYDDVAEVTGQVLAPTLAYLRRLGHLSSVREGSTTRWDATLRGEAELADTLVRTDS